MDERFLRSEPLLGACGLERLAKARVAVFGVGGVGGYAVEALARAGVEKIAVIDNDVVSVSNINRQIIALTDTVGRPKVEVARERILAINPSAEVETYAIFYSSETADTLELSGFDYIIDAIDSVSSKIELITRAKALGVPIISSMGTGNKLDPTALTVSDISKTSVCPLAKAIRTRLRALGIKGLKVVWSPEEPQKAVFDDGKRHAPGSVSFVPPVAGFILASEVIKDVALYRLHKD